MKTGLSYGGGTQTRRMLYDAIEGNGPHYDIVIFADTQREPPEVYEAIERDKVDAQAAGIEFVVTTKGDLGAWQENGSIHIPLYTMKIGPMDGSYDKADREGQLFRTCTDRFKIAAVRAECRARGWDKEGVTFDIGFSVDEISRMKPPPEDTPKWVTFQYSLLDRGIRRSDCEAFLRERDLPVIKSSCYMCPWKSRWSWSALKTRQPEAFARAVLYDESIRDARPGYKSYCHQDRIPLTKVPDLPPGLFDQDDQNCDTGFCFGG